MALVHNVGENARRVERRLTNFELIADSSSSHGCRDTPTARSEFPLVLAAPISKDCRDAELDISIEGPRP